jgi:16S rRNA (uracil1498-N3)-methyltransferase
VLRLQPGAALTLFDGRGGQWQAEIQAIGRKDVQVSVLRHDPTERELARSVTLAPAMVANERMDMLIEKATELGAAAVWPLHCERSVLRLAADRGERRSAHWRAVAAAACEQSGRNRVPEVAAPRPLRDALAAVPEGASALVLSLAADARGAAALLPALDPRRPVVVFSGPEGGLTPDEEAAARAAGCIPVSLGPRTLRADTAPLALLAVLALPEGAA